MQYPEHGTTQEQLDPVRIHPDGGTVITTRMPSEDECTRGYRPGVPVLVVTYPSGVDRVYGGDTFSLVIGDREASPEEERDAARSVLAEISTGLEDVASKLDRFAEAAGRSGGSVVTLAAELADERKEAFGCADQARYPRQRQPLA